MERCWATSRRCVNCGHVHDAVIEQHSRAQQQKVLVLPVVSRTIRMTRSILARSPSSDKRPDIGPVQQEGTYRKWGCADGNETTTENTAVFAIDGKRRLS